MTITLNQLFQAIKENNLSEVEQLISNKINLEQQDRRGVFTPLEYAVYLCHLEIVQVLLLAGASLSNNVEWLLETARSEERIDILMELLKYGINVNQRILDETKTTILIDLASRGSIDVIRALVEAGADVNIVDDTGEFALYSAARNGHEKVYSYLYPLTSSELRAEAEEILPKGLIYRQRLNDEFTEDFIGAAAMNRVNDVIEAIKKGVNINAFGVDENTALYIAANWGYISLVRILVEAGANLELGREDDRKTPLMAAVNKLALAKSNFGSPGMEKNLLEIIRFLLSAGADVNAKTTEGWNALEAATNSGSIEAVELLLAAGADVNAKDRWGDTALSRAEKVKNTEIIQLLLDAGATED
jgi:uncharacterized protein